MLWQASERYAQVGFRLVADDPKGQARRRELHQARMPRPQPLTGTWSEATNSPRGPSRARRAHSSDDLSRTISTPRLQAGLHALLSRDHSASVVIEQLLVVWVLEVATKASLVLELGNDH